MEHLRGNHCSSLVERVPSAECSLVRNVLAQADPRCVIVFSRDELKQYEMLEEFAADPRLRFILGDVRDRERLARGIDNV